MRAERERDVARRPEERARPSCASRGASTVCLRPQARGQGYAPASRTRHMPCIVRPTGEASAGSRESRRGAQTHASVGVDVWLRRRHGGRPASARAIVRSGRRGEHAGHPS